VTRRCSKVTGVSSRPWAAGGLRARPEGATRQKEEESYAGNKRCIVRKTSSKKNVGGAHSIERVLLNSPVIIVLPRNHQNVVTKLGWDRDPYNTVL
jgi:hypothetical protein